MKKFIAIILTFCLILCAFPLQAMAYPGDIWRPGDDGGKVVQKKLENGALALQNDYLRVTLQKTPNGTYLTTIPTAVEQNEGKTPRTMQYPLCTFVTYEQGKPTSHYVFTLLRSMEFVQRTPNGENPAIKAEYDLTIWWYENNTTFPAAVTVYHELVKLQDKTKQDSKESWGVLTTVGQVRMKKKDFPQDLMTDHHFQWEYQLEGFTGMGHYDTASSQSGPAPKMSHTTVKEAGEGGNATITSVSTASTTITSRIDDLGTYTSPKGYTQAGEKQGIYLTEVYVDSYPWANPFVGLSDYYKKEITTYNGTRPIRVELPQTVTVVPSDRFDRMWVECTNRIGIPSYDDDTENGPADKAAAHYLWGFRDLVQDKVDVPTEPDQIDFSITAKRLAVFQAGNGVTVEYVADDAALTTLKKKYNNAEPVALISGDYTSKKGEPFEFTGNAAMLSPSVTATWDKSKGGKLKIHRNGTIEQKGVHLSAPTFKFYQPKSDAEDQLTIELDENGFIFNIKPENNAAIIAVDIPYATTKLKQATADVKGNLVFSGHIGFKTIFDGANFTMEKLGYGLQEKTVGGKKTYEFKVNGVHATGSFNTADLLSLELASVKGEVNTFKGEERYAFELELNAFDLFETEATLALERSKKDGSLIPDELWFYVKASPGIVLVPPIPIGQLNGGGAGFKDLAATVNGNYFAIPPLKLRGALSGTYLHLVEGRGDVVLGPSEISLKASEVGLVGTNLNIVESFGYSLKLEGQEREYKGKKYQGIYFAGAEELKLGLLHPNFKIIEVESGMELGAFGGVDADKKNLYLGIGANGKATGRLLIPNGFPFAGKSIGSADMELIIGGHTTTEIKDTSVSESMRNAFQNIDPYLGVMAQGEIPIFKARAWVLIPHIVKTKFRKGGGWDLEIKIFKKLSDWNWADHGVTPVVQSAPQRLFMPLQTEAAIGEVIEQENAALQAIVLPPEEGKNSATITVNAGADETAYILLDFGTDVTNVTEEEIKANLTVNKTAPNWTDTGDTSTEIFAATDVIQNNKDNQQHRVVLLRLPSANASYNINAGTLTFTHEQKNVTPFEKLEMAQDTSNSDTLGGQIKYAEPNVQYTLRTYLGAKQGKATYLVDEQVVTGSTSGVDTAITQFTVPTNGTHAPSGDYYVTTVLMTEKEATMENGQKVSALAAIDSWQFDKPVSYTNTNQPAAPTDVKLEATGNEVMQASWTAADKADGYAVKIYQQKTQKDGSKTWEDTGFGYDVDASKTSIDMAMTVGGNAVLVNENGTAAESVLDEKLSANLSANETYKVGVRAYKEKPLLKEPVSTGGENGASSTGNESSTSGTNQTKKEVAKYYSQETCSDEKGTPLPAYTPLNFDLKVNGVTCSKDDYGVYNAYVGGKNAEKKLTITCNDTSAKFSVTWMKQEKKNTIPPDASTTDTFTIPDFTGSLMLCVEGKSGDDTTRKFLLVSTDDTPPVLTLSSAVFYADPESGAYTITGTADAGSQILYGDANQEPVTAAGDGSFRVSGTLAKGEPSASIPLAAKDSAGNESASQLAMVSRQVPTSETPSGGSYVPSAQQPTIQSGEGATVALNADGTAAKIVLQEGYELVDVTLNGVSQGKVTEIRGLKTGDKLVVITKKQETLEQQEQKRDKQVKQTFDALKLKARSKKLKNGNIRISFAGQFAEFEALAKQGYTIKYRFYRSTKKSSGYKRMFLSEQPIYINTHGKRGTMYYYKAIALAYNKDGKLIAKTELKQCRYAKRRWTK